MSKNSALLLLINQLSPPEKAYFKKNFFQFTGGKEVNYKVIFDRILEYGDDDNNFLSQYISSSQISRVKSYLYEQLLSSLESYAVGSDQNFQIKRSLNKCYLLFQKGLIVQAKQWVEKTILQAHNSFSYHSLLEAYSIKRKILMTELNLKEMKEIILEEEKIHLLLEEIRDMDKLYLQVVVNSFTKGNIINRTELEKYKEEFGFIVKMKVEQFNSVIAISQYYRIASIYYTNIRNLELSCENAWMRVELLEANPLFIENDHQNYINALNNAIDISIFTSRIIEAEKLSIKLKNFKPKSLFYIQRKNIRYCITRMQIDVYKGVKKSHDEMIKSALTFLHSESDFLRKDERVEMYFLLSALLFNNGDYKNSKTEIVKFLAEPLSDIRIDSQCYMRLMLIYIYFTQGEYEYLENLIKNTHRFLRNKNFLHGTEKFLLDFIKGQIENKLRKKSFLREINNYKQKLDQVIEMEGDVSFGKFIHFN